MLNFSMAIEPHSCRLSRTIISPANINISFCCPQNFRKYMTYKKDYNDLLLLLLRTLVKDALHFEEIVSGSTSRLTHVEVKVEDLKNKVTHPSIPPYTSQEYIHLDSD